MRETHLPLILLSGIMCTEKLWEKQVMAFPKIIDVIIPKITQKKSIHDLADEILKQNAEKFNLIGFSSGGFIAQEIIRQSPKSVNKLMLICTSGGEYSQRQQKIRKYFINICKAQGTEKGLRKFTEKINATYIISSLAIAEFNTKMIGETNPEIFLWQFKAVYDFNLTAPPLEKITCLTKIIASDNDPLITKEAHEEMKKSILSAELIVFKDGGHMLPVSKPKEILDLIIDFFDYI